MKRFNGANIARDLRKIFAAMSSIRNALNAKGISMVGVPISQYADKIRGLGASNGTAGSGGGDTGSTNVDGVRHLKIGETVQGELTTKSKQNGAYYIDEYVLEWDDLDSRNVVITLTSEFTPYLYMVYQGGMLEGTADYRVLSFKLTDYNSPIRVVVETYNDYEVGKYSLSALPLADDGDIGIDSTNFEMWMFLVELDPTLAVQHPSRDIFESYFYPNYYDDPLFQITMRAPWKTKAPDGSFNPNANSYLGALVTAPAPNGGEMTITIMDMDTRHGQMMVLIKQGIHDPYISYESELDYRSPRFNYEGQIFSSPRVVELPLNGAEYFNATDYLVNIASSGIEDDHFVVYFPNRDSERTLTVEGYLSSPIDGVRIQFEIRDSSTTYSLPFLTIQSSQLTFEPYEVTVPAGAPGIRFLVTYEQPVGDRQVFIRVREVEAGTVELEQPPLVIEQPTTIKVEPKA
jgi:hypothetical protein